MPDILRTLLLLDREKWNLGYHLSNFQTLFMIFLVQVLALQHYYNCDDFLVTGNNLDEKKETAKRSISITNVNEYGKYSQTPGNEFECFTF